MKRASVIFSVAVGLVLVSGCAEEFSPKGTYEQRLVVFSVLTTRSDSQIVRVYSTYNPSGHNPLANTTDPQAANAQVTLTVDGSQKILQQVSIPRTDRSRYTDDIVGYLAHPYSIAFGKSYSMSISSPEGTVTAELTVPGRGEIAATNSYILKTPEKYDEDLTMRVRPSRLAQGYLARIVLEFETGTGAAVVRHREEVPQRVFEGDGVTFQFEYPKLVRRSPYEFQVYELVYFALDAYKVFLVDVKSRHGEIRLTGAWYVLTQVDPGLYAYYGVVNGFLDEYSIRTDLPDFGNIRGGLGVFGAMAEDSLFVDLR